MTPKDMVRAVEQGGTKVSKEKLVEALRRLPSKDVAFLKDAASGYSILIVKLG